jgi:hypothetical protein
MAASEEVESRISGDPTPELRDLKRQQIIKKTIQATRAVKIDSASWALLWLADLGMLRSWQQICRKLPRRKTIRRWWST